MCWNVSDQIMSNRRTLVLQGYNISPIHELIFQNFDKKVVQQWTFGLKRSRGYEPCRD